MTSIQNLILEYQEKFGTAKRADIGHIVLDKLSDANTVNLTAIINLNQECSLDCFWHLFKDKKVIINSAIPSPY